MSVDSLDMHLKCASVGTKNSQNGLVDADLWADL